MPNEYLDKVNLDGTTYDIKDTISGYITGITVDNGSATTNLVTSSSNPYNASTNALATMADIGAAGGGTVTSVGLSNASGESDFTITGSPITSSGTFTIEHSNSITAKTTEAVYPVKIDKHGHITSVGTAVTIPTVNNGDLKLQKNTGTASSLFTANQSGDSTLKFTTTSVGSASGWNAGTMASIDTSKFSGGSFTQGVDSFTANTPTVIDTSKFSGGSFTSGTFSQGGLSMSGGGSSASSPSTLTVSFTAPTHASDSFTSASLGTGFYSAGSAASFTQGTDQHTAASLGTGFYSAGTAPSLTVSSTTVVNDISKV